MTASPAEYPERLVSIREAADTYGVSEAVLRRMIRNRELTAVDVSAPGATRPSYRVRPSDVGAVLDRRVIPN